MPYDITKSKSGGSRKALSLLDVFGDVTYLSRKMGMSPQLVWDLPHSHFLAYVKWNVTYDLQETEEGREVLEKWERYNNPRTYADLSAIRNLGGYRKKEGE